VAAQEAMASQDPQSSTLNPGMVYRPASGPRAIDDDDSPVKPVKFPFNAVIFTRALILVFSLTDICLMLSWRYGLRSELVFAIIFTFFCFFWNIIVLLQFLFQAFRKKKDDVSVFSLPRFHLQFGSCNVTCGGDDDDDEGGGDQDSEGRHLLDGGDAPKRSNPLRKNVQRTVDLIHGIALLIGGLVAETNRYWWHVAEPVFVLLLLISYVPRPHPLPHVSPVELPLTAM